MATATFPNWTGPYTRQRRLVQLGFLAAFVAMPLFDLFRFDFEASRLYLFRQEIWLDEWALLWLALMFAMWLVGAASLALGRVYCAYACPQTVFSEIAHDIDALAKRLTRRMAPPSRPRAAKAVSLALVAVVSTVASVLTLAYFAPLPDVVSRLVHLDVRPWIGAIGAITTVLGFLNVAFVRETFCRTACPYGLLQGVIEDGRSLHVRLDESAGRCIDCKACARVCPMDIDIRDGSFQIECTRCGSCIDECHAILGRLKPPRPGVLVFDKGGGLSLKPLDAKRVLVAVATVGFGVALAVAVARRELVSFQLSPVYASDAAQPAGGATVESRYLLRAANRTKAPVVLRVRTEGLPAGALVDGLGDGTLPPGEERRFEVVVRVPSAAITGSVTPFTWVVDTADGRKRLDSTFFARMRKAS
ncbi:MAG: 4Fe-4S dicluster domain-containing protein [Vicinamibacteria bacterium]